jgi:hypothetical protein
MVLDVKAALDRIQDQRDTAASSASLTSEVAEVAAPRRSFYKRKPPQSITSSGRFITWTGGIVPPERWEQLNDYERYGPSG